MRSDIWICKQRARFPLRNVGPLANWFAGQVTTRLGARYPKLPQRTEKRREIARATSQLRKLMNSKLVLSLIYNSTLVLKAISLRCNIGRIPSRTATYFL
jgi:hypothetical protein